MSPPSDDLWRHLAAISHTHDDFIKYLGDWYNRELRLLPIAKEGTAVLQGRCQVLGELNKLFHDASLFKV